VVVPRDDPAALAAALAALVADPDRRTALAEAGRRRAAAFTWTSAARTLWTVYARARGQPA